MGGVANARGWVSVADAAKAAGVGHRTMRRRLLRLNERFGGGVLESYEPKGARARKYWVNPAVLKLAVDGQTPELERRLENAEARVALVEKKVQRLADSHKALKRKVNPSAPGG